MEMEIKIKRPKINNGNYIERVRSGRARVSIGKNLHRL